jgi:multidrug resistance efflux pump
VSAQSPREVLEAVRRLEADLEGIRRRAQERERDLAEVRAGIAADAARERRALVEDLERVVELIGASWRSTSEQIAALSGEVAGLRRFAEGTVGALSDARLELRLARPNGSRDPD